MDDVFNALRHVYSKCQGAFACTAMIAGYGILGFRQVAWACISSALAKVLLLETRMAFGPFVSDLDYPPLLKESGITF